MSDQLSSDQLSNDLASLKIHRDDDDDDAPRRPGRSGGFMRVVIGLLIVAGLGAAGWLFVVPAVEGKVFKTQVSFTEVQLVSPAQASTQLTSTGYVVPQTLSKVSAKISGRVAFIPEKVKEGAVVKAGQVLLQIEDADLRASVAAAQSRVLAARARAQTARANVAEFQQQAERTKALVAQNAAPRSTAEDLGARVKALEEGARAADAEARAAAAEVSSLEVNLRFAVIKAPIDGTILTKLPAIGDLVGPLTGPVAEMADFSSLLVEADVPEARLHLIHEGGPCEISLDAFPAVRYRGAVKEKGQRVNRAKATVTVKVRFVDDPKNVLPDMAARISFLAKELDAKAVKEPPKLVLPSTALAERAGSRVVFVVDGDVVHLVPVTLGDKFGEGYELVAGPSAGARVVKHPPPTLAEGQKVKEKEN